MFDKIAIMRMAHGLASHAAERQAVIARNIANADTPGYRTLDIPSFADTFDPARSGQLRITRPGHIGADGQASRLQHQRASATATESAPNGNSVSLEMEMVKSTEARRAHDLALAVYSSSLDILRTSLGRGR